MQEARKRLSEVFDRHPQIADDIIAVIADYRAAKENELSLPVSENTVEAGIKQLRLNSALQELLGMEITFQNLKPKSR